MPSRGWAGEGEALPLPASAGDKDPGKDNHGRGQERLADPVPRAIAQQGHDQADQAEHEQQERRGEYGAKAEILAAHVFLRLASQR